MDQNNIKTFARLKPLQKYQKGPMFVKKNNAVVCLNNHEEFRFNQVFDQNNQNQEIFRYTYGQMIEHNFNGYNSCILAYGQTSSGKTYTMKGTETNPGIIPLCINSIFNKIKQKGVGSQLSVSYFEIYNQNVYDLLSNNKNVCLQLREEKKILMINQLTQKFVQNSDDAMKQFQFGQTNRKFADNNINLSSSRSHVIFRINLKIVIQERRQIKQICSQINMVDLAGSEGVGRTKAEGHLKKQGENINKSILALSCVIRSMSDKKQYTNFRDSKLTRILQSSLCHNSKSIIICTLNVNEQNLQESLNTLKFCNIASKVQILSKQNMKSKPTQVKFRQEESIQNIKLKDQQEILKQQNSKLTIQLVTYKKMYLQKKTQCQLLIQQQSKLNQQIYMMTNQKQMLHIKIAQNQHFKQNSEEKQNRFNDIEQMTRMNNQIIQYKGKFQRYKTKYDNLMNDFKIVSRNEKTLLDQLNNYKNQIQQLKQTIQNKSIVNKNDDKKPQQKRIYNFHSSPFDSKRKIIPVITVQTVIQLKQKILNINRQLINSVNQNGELRLRINSLESQNYEMNQALQNQQAQSNINSQSKSMRAQKTQITQRQFYKLKRKVVQLKKQNQICRQRQQKAIKKVKKMSNISINLFDQFQQWKYRRNKSNEVEVQTQIILQLENDKQENNQILTLSKYRQKIKMNPQKQSIFSTSKNLSLNDKKQSFFQNQLEFDI